MLILDNRRALAERHIKQLEERREKIPVKLQRVHDALTYIAGKEQPRSLTAEMCSKKGRTPITLAAAKFWLSATGNGNMPFTDSALLTGMVFPEEVKELITALIAVNGQSEDPERYYQGESFKALPVTPAEKESIFARSEIYANDSEAVELYSMVNQRCKLANFANSQSVNDGTRVRLYDISGPTNPLYRQFVGQRDTPKGSAFFVLLDHLGSNAEFHPAFDEGVVSMDEN